ncbi:ABC transporter substrate-binding protein [Pseudonocardia oroxyli]|uniref:Peptide/nickel transport system substrate-binding protein n=1 Tax=Pseudonocardia oroxyli TaxID=366584 RepID=A0A1G7TRS3_PSEOR|nr:ABC transporter substrate-binding protein [Pseudonocardia oroxyli]SDG38006.1 peptide/nickel transport system substrate-binding protein [Pseudonocardia oroxyli]
MRFLRSRGGAALAAISAALVLLAGCGGSTQGGADEPSGPPQSGGSATFGVTGDVSGTFDPAKLLSVSGTIADGTVGSLLYGGLVETDPKTQQVVPVMAKSLTSDDGTVWSLVLRDGLKFSDGTAFDAAAVKLNWERHADPALASGARGVASSFASLEVVDPTTLRITLKDINFQFPRSLALFAVNWIASPAAIRAGTLGENPVGAGPFLLKERLRDDHMTFVRNPAYYDAPRPYLDQVVLRPIPDGAQRLNSAATGQLDGLVALTRNDAVQGEQQGLQVLSVAMSGGTSMYFNFAKPTSGDVRFRQAMRLAIDNAAVSEAVEQGNGPETSTFFAPDTAFYDQAAAFPKPDLAAAQKLIDEMAAERGGPISFTFLVDQRNEQLGTAVQTQLAALKNLDMKLEVASQFLPTQRQASGDYEVSVQNNFNLDPEPRIGLLLQPGNARNFLRYDNPEMTAVMQAGRATQDLEQRKAAYRKFDEIVNRDVPWVLFLRANPNVLWDGSKLRDISVFEDGIVHWDRVWRAGT